MTCVLDFIPSNLFEDFELILSFLVLWMIKQFWSNGEGSTDPSTPHGSRDLKAGPKQPGFYEREAGGTCCSETDGNLWLLNWVSHANYVYNIYYIYIHHIQRMRNKAFVVHQLFKSTQNASGYRILSVPYTVQGLGEMDRWLVGEVWVANSTL